MNWLSTKRKDRFTFEMVDPNDINDSRGWLEGVIASSCRINLGYYTDTRVAAIFDAVNPNYIENSLIRIHHYVDEWEYHAELGTFFVKNINPSTSRGVSVQTFDLASMLTRISDDAWVSHYVIKTGAYTNSVLADIFNKTGVDYRIMPDVSNTKYTAAKIYDIGDSVLSTAFEVSDKATARLELVGHGDVIVEPYVSPSVREPAFEFTDTNGTIIGKIKITSDFYETFNRIGVVSKKDDVEAVGYADLPSTSPMSRSRRGRRKTEVHKLDEMSPFSSAEAAARAKKLIASESAESREFEFESIYTPLVPGDVVSIVINNESVKAMLKSCEVTLSPGMPCKNTFKEV